MEKNLAPEDVVYSQASGTTKINYNHVAIGIVTGIALMLLYARLKK